MVKIVKKSKPMTVDPIKVSQTMGATLAFLGLDKSMPLLHGNQGCSAYGKILFIRHFLEPVPIQTTALDHLSAIMEPDKNLKEAMLTICKKDKPEVIGVLTTGVTEAEGTDIKRVIKEFREEFPEHDDTLLIPVSVPDYQGCLESGYAKAVESIIENVIVQRFIEKRSKSHSNDLVIIPSAMHTPADIETMRLIIEMFGLNPIFLPDLSLSLDGHLSDLRYSPISYGGCSKTLFERIANSLGVITVGRSVKNAGMLLHLRAGIPFFHMDGLIGLEANDSFISILMQLSGNAVPEMFKRQRKRLRDAYLDTHFYLGQSKMAVASDPDLLIALQSLAAEIGIELQYGVTSDIGYSADVKSALQESNYQKVQEGDFEDFRKLICSYSVDLVVANSYLTEFCEEQELAHYRAGYPIYDRIGGSRVSRVGYEGTADIAVEMANLIWQRRPEGAEPYISDFRRYSGDAYDTASTSYASH